MSVVICQHPLAQIRMTIVRDAATDAATFRRATRELASLVFLEATRDLPLQAVPVTTPLATCTGQRLASRIGLFPILRAGLALAEPILDLVPNAVVHHLGIYRDHTTCQPVSYYQKLPTQLPVDLGFVLDPMLATAGSACAVLTGLKNAGLRQLRFVGLIGAPEGVQRLATEHPDVPIYLAALDSHLDALRYIVPGLGDAGDRQFNTGT